MGKKYKSVTEDPTWIEAHKLNQDIKGLVHEIQILDMAISEMQVKKAETEFNGTQVTPFFSRVFSIRKKSKTKEFFLEPSNYYLTDERCICVCEAELLMIRSFKQKQLDELNAEVQRISSKINENPYREVTE